MWVVLVVLFVGGGGGGVKSYSYGYVISPPSPYIVDVQRC